MQYKELCNWGFRIMPLDKAECVHCVAGCQRACGCCKAQLCIVEICKRRMAITNSKTVEGIKRFANEDKLQSRSNIALPHLEASSSHRHLLVSVGPSLATLACGLSPSMVWAIIKSLFDPNEKTKSGKVLPKAYLKSAREVVKTLSESLNETSYDIAKFRRTADSAKESIREYLGSCRGNQTVVQEVWIST